MSATDPNNADRASWAAQAVQAFGARTGQADYDLADPEMFSEIVPDLIGDLVHLCDLHDMDPVAVLQHGLQHYVFESAAEAHPDETGSVDYVCDPHGDIAVSHLNAVFDDAQDGLDETLGVRFRLRGLEAEDDGGFALRGRRWSTPYGS